VQTCALPISSRSSPARPPKASPRSADPPHPCQVPTEIPMFIHNKRLMYTVRVARPDPDLATLMLEQFGGPQGELAAAMRYFTQALGDNDPGRKDMLYDIATEELSHLEIIGSIIAMLNSGPKAVLSEG